jgi:serine phosphatase RsbU (regulator of sigma subunit)
MRIANWAVATLAILSAAPAFAQTTANVHAAAKAKVQPVVPNTAVVQQNMYQQNQQAQQGALQDTTQSQQRVQALSQRNQQMLQAQQSTGASVTPH